MNEELSVCISCRQCKSKDEQINITKLKFCEFISMIREIKECDKESADKINLWINGNWDFLEKLKSESVK